MTTTTVLVIGSPGNKGLREVLLRAGMVPVFRETILAAITALRRDRFFAVVLDGRTATVDVLEAILNIRDLDSRLRLFVLKGRRDVLPGGLNLPPDVSSVDLDGLTRKLAPEVVPIVQEDRRNVITNRNETGPLREAHP